MTGETSAPSRLLALGLALALAVYTVVSYPLPLVGEVTASTILLALVVAVGHQALSRQLDRRFSSFVLRPWSFSPTTVFLLVFSTVATIQTLVAREIYGPLRAIDRTPGYAILAHLLHYLVVTAVVLAGRERSHAVGLAAAMVYTSVFYSPTFATPEAAPPFIPLAALALVLLTTQIANCELRIANYVSPLRQAQGRLLRLCSEQGFTSLIFFILFALIASLLSYSQDDSLSFLCKLLTLVIFALAIPLSIRTPTDWKRMALLVVVVSVFVPVLLSIAKLMELTWQLGMRPAIRYRLGLAELGRGNLIARTLMVGAPLLLAQAVAATRRTQRALTSPLISGGTEEGPILWWGLSALALLVFVTCRSWGGWIGLGVTCTFAAVLQFGQRWIAWWKTHRSGIGQYLFYATILAILAIVGLGFLGLLRLAPQSNVRSFNGRLFQFRAALLEMAHHPLPGVGPGHYFIKSRYTPGLGFLVETQATLDDPLMPVQWLRGSTRLHTHNLFLEIGVGTGLLGLAAFVWFLVALFRFGLRTRAQLRGQDRVLLTGCLAGIVASLGWGLLDVMEISSPFFTFPTWALVGLLLAAPRALNVDEGRRTEDGDSSFVIRHSSSVIRHPKGSSVISYVSPLRLCSGQGFTFHVSRFTFHATRFTLLFVVAFFAVVVPLFGNQHYRAAYTAYQERRWDIAADELARAARWEPLNGKYQQMRGEALINLGRYDEAISAYERAIRLKRDYAPYHAQLGWLYWLQGGLEQATTHFQKAVEMDPREAWRDGLHADLGLAYVAQGRVKEAIPLFKETIALGPEMVLAPYWVPLQGADGGFDVALDPVYMAGPSQELEKRILAHLGKADYAPGLFAFEADASSPLSLDAVLDAIESDYAAARATGSREAPRLLATAAEAARLVGLYDRAERAFLIYQEVFPESAYGFGDLGGLYREQGRLGEAQRMLERAVDVSPRYTTAWVVLAEAYLDQEMWQNAQDALDTVHRLAPLDARLDKLRAQFYRGQGDPARAADALRRSLVIEEAIPTRLELASLYSLLDQPKRATEQCTQVAKALLRTWPRLLDPQLWETAVCLAGASGGGLPREIATLAQNRPLVDDVLGGHIYRAQGQLDQALEAYQRASAARSDVGAPHYFLGQTYQALGQAASAEVEYRQAAKLDPLESLPLLALGRLQWAQGEREAALESFGAAVEATPGSGQAHTTLGNALLATGDRGGATDHFRLAQAAEGKVRQGTTIDFSAHLAEADVQAPSSDYVKNDYFAINGERRRVLFAHPDSRVRYIVQVPKGAVLTFAVATAPESWEEPGDGVTFAVFIETNQGVEQAFSIYIDPKQNEVDRRWHPFVVNLSRYAGQTVRITFETDSGPAGDDRYDWAGWGAPALLKPHRSMDSRRRRVLHETLRMMYWRTKQQPLGTRWAPWACLRCSSGIRRG